MLVLTQKNVCPSKIDINSRLVLVRADKRVMRNVERYADKVLPELEKKAFSRFLLGGSPILLQPHWCVAFAAEHSKYVWLADVLSVHWVNSYNIIESKKLDWYLCFDLYSISLIPKCDLKERVNEWSH